LVYGFLLGGSLLVLASAGPGCASSPSGSKAGTDTDGTGNGSFNSGGGLGNNSTGSASCNTGLCLKRVTCPDGGDTTVSGVVYDPAGKVPLYNAFVFVPNAPLDAIPPGASCDRCDGTSNVYSGSPLSYAQTDDTGHFKLPNVPVDANVPLVIQVGKWRRENVTVSVEPCQDNVITDNNLTRLPKNHTEGNIPRIAITTGAADTMECLPRRMGIDDSEFSVAGGPGRIQLFRGGDRYQRDANGTIQNDTNGNPIVVQSATTAFDGDHGGGDLAPATDLWSTKEALSAYDVVMLSCEGETDPETKPPSSLAALYEYEKAGGRVFASHWHRYWFSDGPDPVPSVATGGSHNGWKSDSAVHNGAWQSFNSDGTAVQTATINDKFTKGAAFADWLQTVGATKTRGELEISAARDDLNSVDHGKAQDWATIPQYHYQAVDSDGNIKTVAANPAPAVQFMSYNAPIGAPDDQVCGRAVFTDLHVSSGAHNDSVGANKPFPSGCDANMDLSPEEKALEFMLFDVSSCVSSDNGAPPPPVRIH